MNRGRARLQKKLVSDDLGFFWRSLISSRQTAPKPSEVNGDKCGVVEIVFISTSPSSA